MHQLSHIDDCAGTGPSADIDSHYAKLLQRFDGRVLGECDGQVFLGVNISSGACCVTLVAQGCSLLNIESYEGNA